MTFRHNHNPRSTNNHETVSGPEPTFSLILSDTELYYIDDAISLRLPNYDRSLSVINGSGKVVAAPMDMIERVGTCIPEIVATGNKTAEIDITFIDAIILREIADARIYINDNPIGLTLKRKLHALLYTDFYENKLKTKKLMKGINEKNEKS